MSNRSNVGQATLWAALFSVFWTCSCKQVLGIDPRRLDTAELSVEGYAGCEPTDGVCDGCTSEWHTCVCEGWKSKPEAVLRRDCADEAPPSIREKVVTRAEREFEEYEEELESADPSANGDPDDTEDQTPEDPREDGAPDDGPSGAGDAGSEPDDPAGPSSKPDLSALTHFNAGFCAFSEPPDDCQGCFCGECTMEIEDCQADWGCATIFDCYLSTRCEPLLESSPVFCGKAEYCGAVIEENGGPTGAPKRQADDTVGCNIEANCPCGTPQQPAGPGNCIPGDCGACSDCWARCFCEGKNDTQCVDECGSPSCSSDDQCSTCNDCMDSCFCLGLGDRGVCQASCSSGGQPCTPETGCSCDNCFDSCVCGGEDATTCGETCPPPTVGPPQPITCGSRTCEPLILPPPDPVSAACCAGPEMEACGIEGGPIFGPAHQEACVPREAAGREEPQCPSLTPSFAPFDEMSLAGCCTPAGTCGYIDPVNGLGCMRADLFLPPAEPVRNCTY